MIAYLKGKIINKGQAYIVILVKDIGYKVFVNETIYADIDIGQDVELYIYQHVREDSLALYGFNNMLQLEMFELLLSISGIGPKSALGVLAMGRVEDLQDAIARGDFGMLTKVSGIGKKTAERVVLELREKVASIDRGSTQPDRTGQRSAISNSDEIDALMALGYSLTQARDALHGVDPKIKESGERIKAALKIIT